MPTVSRTTRSSLLTPLMANATVSCSAASAASAARHLRVAPRRGRSWTCTTTVSLSTAAVPLITLRSMVIAPCFVPGGNLPHGDPNGGTQHAVSCAVVTGSVRQVLPVSHSAKPARQDSLANGAKSDRPVPRHLSGRRLLRSALRLDDGRLGLGRRRHGYERSQRAEAVGRHLGGQQVRLCDLAVDLFAVDRHLAGGLEPQPHRAAADLDDVHLDVVADADRLADAARESEHLLPLHGLCWPPGTGGAVSATHRPTSLSAQGTPDRMRPVREHDLAGACGGGIDDDGSPEVRRRGADVPVRDGQQAVQRRIGRVLQAQLGADGPGQDRGVVREVPGRGHGQEPRTVGSHRLQPEHQPVVVGTDQHVVPVPGETGQRVDQPEHHDRRGQYGGHLRKSSRVGWITCAVACSAAWYPFCCICSSMIVFGRSMSSVLASWVLRFSPWLLFTVAAVCIRAERVPTEAAAASMPLITPSRSLRSSLSAVVSATWATTEFTTENRSLPDAGSPNASGPVRSTRIVSTSETRRVSGWTAMPPVPPAPAEGPPLAEGVLPAGPAP